MFLMIFFLVFEYDLVLIGHGCAYQRKCSETSCHDGWRLASHTNTCVKDECRESALHIGGNHKISDEYT